MEILYVEEDSRCPYMWTESRTLRNIASVCGIGDFPGYMGEGLNCAYHVLKEYTPFIEFLDSTGIEYRIVYKDVEWFQTEGGI